MTTWGCTLGARTPHPYSRACQFAPRTQHAGSGIRVAFIIRGYAFQHPKWHGRKWYNRVHSFPKQAQSHNQDVDRRGWGDETVRLARLAKVNVHTLLRLARCTPIYLLVGLAVNHQHDTTTTTTATTAAATRHRCSHSTTTPCEGGGWWVVGGRRWVVG